MEDPRVSWLIGIFKDEFRQNDGLTTRKMRNHPELIELLVGDGIAEEAKAELEEIVLGMGDGYLARAVRNSLVISNGSDGIEARGGPENRRKWAAGADDRSKSDEDRFIPRVVRRHPDYEEEGFEELAKLILDRAAARAEAEKKAGPHQGVGPVDVEPRDLHAQDRGDTHPHLDSRNHDDQPGDGEPKPTPGTNTFIKELPTFPEAFRAIRGAFTRAEYLYIPDRLRHEKKPGHGEGLAMGLFLGLIFALIILFVVLNAAGVISK